MRGMRVVVWMKKGLVKQRNRDGDEYRNGDGDGVSRLIAWATGYNCI